MKNIKSKFQPSRNEKGVASIMAIGICTILLALAIAYVTTAIIEKKASINYQNLAVARLTAQTSFTRALAYMKEKSTSGTDSFNLIVSHDENLKINTSDSSIYWDNLPYELTTVIEGDTYYSLADDYPSGYGDITDTDNVTWIYLRRNQTNAGGNETDTIVSRIAYVVIPDKGKIDPWSAIDSGVNAASFYRTPPSESNYGGVSTGYATSVDANGNYVIGRPGRNINEMSLASLEYDTTRFTNAYTINMGPQYAGGLVPPNGEPKWLDFSGLFDSLAIASTDVNTRNYFRDVFYLNSPDDPEAFWIDLSNDSIRDSSELFHRFDLTGIDWDNITVNDLETSLRSSFDSDTGINCPPWLTNWQSPGDYSLIDIAKRQILANLIDYCDSDTNATTDNPGNPSYLGLERCPYINEVKIKVAGSLIRSGTATSNYQWSFSTVAASSTPTPNFTNSVYPAIYVEEVDMYGITDQIAAPSTRTRAYVDTMRVEYAWGVNYGTGTDTINVSNTPTITISTTPYNSYVSSFIDMSQGNLSQLNQSIPATGTRLSDSTTLGIRVRISNLKIRLASYSVSDATQTLYDYVNLPDTPWMTLIPTNTAGTTRNGYLSIDYQCADPRQNLNTSDWKGPSTSSSYYLLVNNTLATPSVTSDTGTVFGYPSTITQTSAKNQIFIPNASGNDPEPTATQPWDISTAYIRNAPMQSPWELGFIHRAKAFQTLNLKKYNNTSTGGVIDGAGGGNYANGDANILDQIKMTSATYTRGKININSDNQSVLRALFDNIKLGSNLKTNPDPGFFNSGQVNTSITSTQADSPIAYQLTVNNGSKAGTSTKPFLTRAQIADTSRIPCLSIDDSKLYKASDTTHYPYISRTTDAQQEELIGKFINLTKEETPNLYTVIAVGQVIKDVGGVTITDKDGNQTPTTYGKFDIGADQILSSQKILAIIKRNPTTNKFYISRMIYLSE